MRSGGSIWRRLPSGDASLPIASKPFASNWTRLGRPAGLCRVRGLRAFHMPGVRYNVAARVQYVNQDELFGSS